MSRVTHESAVDTRPAGGPRHSAATGRGLAFRRDTAFHLALRERVDAHFLATGRPVRDCWQLYLKAAILLAGFAGSYLLLVFVAET